MTSKPPHIKTIPAGSSVDDIVALIRPLAAKAKELLDLGYELEMTFSYGGTHAPLKQYTVEIREVKDEPAS